MQNNTDYKQWPLRIRQYQNNWTVSYHDPNGRIIHLLSADSQIDAFRSADKLLNLYNIQNEVIMESSTDDRLVDVKKMMHFREKIHPIL